MRMKFAALPRIALPRIAGLLGLAGVGMLMSGCVYVPPGPQGPGYYAPAAAPVVVAPVPVYGGGYYYGRPYYRPYYRY